MPQSLLSGPGGQLPFRPPTPKKTISWTDVLSSLSTAGATIIGGIALARNAPQEFTWLLFGIGVIAALVPIAHGLQKTRSWLHTRAEKKAAALAEETELKRLTVIINDAVERAVEQLAPERSTSNTVAYAIEHLPGYLDGATPSGAEAYSRRRAVIAGCRIFAYLPPVLEPGQVSIVGDLVDRSIHALVNELPEYLDACEKAAAQGERWKHENVMREADLLRDRVNELLEEYNRLAKEAAAASSGRPFLRPFDRGRFLRAPRTSPVK